ncbi:MAG TPA: hypothetical protein VIT21_09670 [Chthoniobacterales bacterium]
MRIPEHYVWFFWASAFLAPWLVLFAVFPMQRRIMWRVSVFTMPFGLTEPLFVPEYWNPPSLFDLAQRTGFDIESLIFCFAIGGVATVLYNALTGHKLQPIDSTEKRRPLHRHHYLTLGSPIIAFLLLLFLPWNPIYPGIIAMFVGALAAILCRPDLKRKTWVGGFVISFLLCRAAARIAVAVTRLHSTRLEPQSAAWFSDFLHARRGNALRCWVRHVLVRSL